MAFMFAPLAAYGTGRRSIDLEKELNAKNIEQPRSGLPTVRQGQTGFWRKTFPEVLRIAGATMRQMDDGASLDNYLAGQNEQRMLSREEGQQNNQRKQMELLLMGLPPETQMMARMAPEAFAESLFRTPPQRYGDLEQIDGRLGQRNEVTGQYDWAPQVPEGERAPQGYRYTPDRSLEAIPGGPADIRAGESAQRNRRFYETAIRNRQNVLESISNARRLSNQPGTTGIMGQVFGGVGGTAPHDLQSEVDTIIGNIGFEALQEMRANSQTGGALGQVAVRELELLQTTIANLRTSQSRGQFQRNLDRVESQYRRTMQAYEAAIQELQAHNGGGAPAEEFVTEQPAPAARRMRWNPQTQRLENAD